MPAGRENDWRRGTGGRFCKGGPAARDGAALGCASIWRATQQVDLLRCAELETAPSALRGALAGLWSSVLLRSRCEQNRGKWGGPSRKASYDTKLQTVRGYVKQIKLCTQDQSLRHTRSRGGAAIISIFSLLYRVKIKGAAAATFRAGWACRDQTNGTVPFWERPLTTTT